jgi:hypothetical protein
MMHENGINKTKSNIVALYDLTLIDLALHSKLQLVSTPSNE